MNAHPNPRGCFRAGRRLAGVLITGAGIAGMMLAHAPVALAQDCPITNLDCVVGTVDDTVTAADQTVKDTTKTAGDDASTAIKDVRHVLDGVSGPGDPGGRTGGGGSGGGHREGGSGGGKGQGASKHRLAVPGAPSVGVLARARGVPSILGTASVEFADHGSGRSAGSSGDVAARLREAAAGIALSLLIMLGAVIGFTIVQDRLDRRSPKLALAPLTTDVVSFE
jgi:hypothetical protein